MKTERKIGACELRTRLGKYLRAVRAGASLVVTERGEPVAELRPVARKADTLGARLDDLAAAGLLSRGSGELLTPFHPAKVTGPSVSAAILEDREDRF